MGGGIVGIWDIGVVEGDFCNVMLEYSIFSVWDVLCMVICLFVLIVVSSLLIVVVLFNGIICDVGFRERVVFSK